LYDVRVLDWGSMLVQQLMLNNPMLVQQSMLDGRMLAQQSERSVVGELRWALLCDKRRRGAWIGNSLNDKL
jgi:hypothetical protein